MREGRFIYPNSTLYTTFLDYDRFGYPNSALNLNQGFKVVSENIIFNGDFSRALWSKDLRNNTVTSAFLDFGNDLVNATGSNLVLGYLNETNTVELHVNSVNAYGSFNTSVISTTPLERGVWNFLVATLEGTIGMIYLNGILVGQNNLNAPLNINRPLNLIGGRRSGNNGIYTTSSAVIDELRIYNRSLSLIEITTLMKTNDSFFLRF